MFKYLILIIVVILYINCSSGWSIEESQCQRNCNSYYDNCYKNPNSNYSLCDSTHTSCMSNCRQLGCKIDCENKERNCEINRKGYGCIGFNLFTCKSLCG